MDLQLEQLQQVESELADLRRTAERLTLTVSNLKSRLEEKRTIAVPEIKALPPDLPKPNTPFKTAADPVGPAKVPTPPAFVTPVPAPAVSSSSQTRDFEMQLGLVWSVRLGIVLLTTGFVFLSRYTYDHIIHDLGPGLRLTFMYLFSFLLTGIGLFCERWKESLKNYGRIVAAGGFAAIYYCGFAAHNIESLKVIENPVPASLLLFASAGLFCAASLWRESRVMLSASLALAFYSVSVNPIGWMACLSALILAGLGIAMMIRHRWVEIGFLVLIGSYLSYLWWQIAIFTGDSTTSHWFLPAYWLLFTLAAVSPGRIPNPNKHLLFTSLNNTAFFILFSFRPDTGTWMDRQWLFCFLFGAALISLFFLTKKTFPDKSRLVHLVKGLSVTTLGLSLLLSGHQLFIALLLEALVLIAVNLRFPNPLSVVASWIVAALSLIPLLEIPLASVSSPLWIIGATGWIVLGILHRKVDQKQKLTGHPGNAVAAGVALALITFGLMAGWEDWHRTWGLAGLGAVASCLSLFHVCKKGAPETLGILILGAFLALGSFLGTPHGTPGQSLWAAALAIVISVPLALQSLKTPKGDFRNAFHLGSALFLLLSLPMIFRAIELASLPLPASLSIVLIIPVLGTLVANRSTLVAHSIVPFLMYFGLMGFGKLDAPCCFLISFVTAGHFALLQTHQLADRVHLQNILFFVCSLAWGLGLIQGLDSPGFALTLTATALLIGSPRFGKSLTPIIAAPYFVLGVALASLKGSPPEVYLSLASLLLLHLFRTAKEDKAPLNGLTVIALLGLWGQITLDTGSAPRAAVWATAGTALLLTGLGLKSRCFRLMGLIVLSFSLGHLMLVDVVKLDPLPRILSFMTLGIGLLGLGFVYNRWQDRLKQIL